MPSPPASTQQPPTDSPRPGRRGELLVVLQFILFFAFLFLPAWNPWLSQDLMASTAYPRLALLVICGLIALVLGLLGLFHLGRNLTPLLIPSTVTS